MSAKDLDPVQQTCDILHTYCETAVAKQLVDYVDSLERRLQIACKEAEIYREQRRELLTKLEEYNEPREGLTR